MTRSELRTLQNKNSVMLALEMAAGEDGLGFGSFAAGMLLPHTDRSLGIVRKTLNLLEDDGVIVRLYGTGTTILIIMDREGAEEHVDDMCRNWGAFRYDDYHARKREFRAWDAARKAERAAARERRKLDRACA